MVSIKGKTTYSPAIITDGLVLCLDAASKQSYPGSGTVWRDLAGSNNGTLINSITFANTNGGVLIFDGTDEYINIPTNPSIDNCLNSDFTYEIWTNPKLTGFSAGKMFAKGAFLQSTGFNGLIYGTSTQRVVLSYGNPSTNLIGGDNGSVLANIWHHIIVTRLGSTLSFYINGILTRSYTNSYDFRSAYPLRISSNSQSDPDDTHQSVAIFRQYAKGFLSTEVLQNYNATKGRFNL